jgi:hypothetical protein
MGAIEEFVQHELTCPPNLSERALVFWVVQGVVMFRLAHGWTIIVFLYNFVIVLYKSVLLDLLSFGSQHVVAA